jgi:hypothetical protein
MTSVAPSKVRAPSRPPRGARRSGYVAAAAINLVLLWLLHVTPGWEQLAFLTDEFVAITGLLTASFVAGVVVNVVYVLADPPWFRRLGEASTAAFACAVLARTWAVFPFELTGWWAGWDTTLRAVVGFLTVATAIAVLANLADLLRQALRSAPAERSR